MFVLRDQTDRKESSVTSQASKLKSKLIEEASKIKCSFDDVMNIDTQDIVLLPNAFAEDASDLINNEIKWRNSIFPKNILDLRGKILNKFQNMNIEAHTFPSLSDFYASMCSYWKTLEDLGDGILNCKDLEEIKVRNEIATKCSKLISQYDDEFYNRCYELMNKAENQLNQKYTEEINSQTVSEIKELYESTLKTIINDYDKQTNLTNLSFSSENIKREYKSNIECSFKRIEKITLNTWENRISNRKQSDALSKINNELIEYASNLIKSGNNVATIDGYAINKKFIKSDKDYENYLKNVYESNEVILKKIEDCYNQNHNRNIFTQDFKNFEITPKISDLETFINRKYEVDINDWFQKQSHIEKGINILKDILKNQTFNRQEIKNWIENTLETETKNCVIECITKPYVEDSHIRNVFIVIKNQFFKKESPVMQFKNFLQLNNLTPYLLKRALSFMYFKYVFIKDDGLNKSRAEYEKMKKEIDRKIKSEIEWMKNSHISGENFATDLIDNMFNLFKDKINQNVKGRIERKLYKILKNPEELVEYTFNKSFKAMDYKNVYKYVRNITKYCTEVSEEMTKEQINAIIDTEVNVFREKLNELFAFLNNTNLQFKIGSKYACIDEIVKIYDQQVSKGSKYQVSKDTKFDSFSKSSLFRPFYMGSMNELDNNSVICELFKRCKLSIIDGKIENIEHFNNSFKTKINSLSEHCQNDCDIYIKEIRSWAKQQNKESLNTFLGCPARCPGCGSKCHLDTGHDGNHKSNRHILNGFFGFRNKKTKVVDTEFCWEEKFYIQRRIYIGEDENEVVYESFSEYLKKCHTDWLSDINDNYIKYGKGNRTQELIDYTFYTRKAWMNTRKPIIYKYSNIIDKQNYETDWLKLEDKKEMLIKTYECDGY